jgi:hypothetical protein
MFDPILAIAQFMLNAFLHVWPYLLITIPLAVAVQMSGTSKYIQRAFAAQPIVAIFLATAVGAFSPFCSCGVIPVVATLLIGGVPLAPVWTPALPWLFSLPGQQLPCRQWRRFGV